MPVPPLTHTDARWTLLQQWLQALADVHGLDLTALEPVSGDASFRRYFRVRAKQGSYIVMDAPPPHEDCRSFIHVATLLQHASVNVPALLAHNTQQGFLLLSDLGTHNYTQAIQQGLDGTLLQTLYRQAIGALVRMQQASTDGLPVYDQARLQQELAIFPAWYVSQYCGITPGAQEQTHLAQCFTVLTEDALRQPRVLVHRDFHSPNLILCPQMQHGINPGIIDFQDALRGAITYDIASLVMDARITWEEAQQLDWAIRYWEAARAAGLPVAPDFADFHRAYEWMGLQRNLRILGVFARLALRDGKPGYLAHMPRVMGYVRQVATRYQVFRPLIHFLDRLENVRPTTPVPA